MPHPLTSDKDRHLKMESEYNLLEWRGMVIPKKIVDEPLILPIRLRSGSIAHTGRLYDTAIRPHIIDKTDKAMVKYRVFLVEDFLGSLYMIVHVSS